MVTYRRVAEVVRHGCVDHRAGRVDSRAILHLVEAFVGALVIWIVKWTNTSIAGQTNKLN